MSESNVGPFGICKEGAAGAMLGAGAAEVLGIAALGSVAPIVAGAAVGVGLGFAGVKALSTISGVITAAKFIGGD